METPRGIPVGFVVVRELDFLEVLVQAADVGGRDSAVTSLFAMPSSKVVVVLDRDSGDVGGDDRVGQDLVEMHVLE